MEIKSRIEKEINEMLKSKYLLKRKLNVENIEGAKDKKDFKRRFGLKWDLIKITQRYLFTIEDKVKIVNGALYYILQLSQLEHMFENIKIDEEYYKKIIHDEKFTC